MKISKDEIIKYAERYDYKETPDESIERELKELLKNQKYLNKEQFIRLCKWKSPRPKKHYESNGESSIIEATKLSFAAKSDLERIEPLLKLKGVSYPVASAILHFAFPDEYPILDFRAIWSLCGQTRDGYLWTKYCDEIRKVSKNLNLPIRIVDKALWKYSKENQPKPNETRGRKVCSR